VVGFRRPITSQYANLVIGVLHTSALNTVQIVTSPISLPWAAYTPKGVFFEILRLGNLQAGWKAIHFFKVRIEFLMSILQPDHMVL
jgi:hypothetical protein